MTLESAREVLAVEVSRLEATIEDVDRYGPDGSPEVAVGKCLARAMLLNVRANLLHQRAAEESEGRLLIQGEELRAGMLGEQSATGVLTELLALVDRLKGAEAENRPTNGTWLLGEVERILRPPRA